jgi:hypothetical protein
MRLLRFLLSPCFSTPSAGPSTLASSLLQQSQPREALGFKERAVAQGNGFGKRTVLGDGNQQENPRGLWFGKRVLTKGAAI